MSSAYRVGKPPVVLSVVGKSGAGKTTLIERLVPELKRRGYRVGTVKHDVHGFEIDHEGKDSYRHFHSGSDTSLIASSQKMAMVKRLTGELPLTELVKRFLNDHDVVITEGYKRGEMEKIEVVRNPAEGLLCDSDENRLIAVVADSALDGISPEVPVFSMREIEKIADFIEEKIMCRRDGSDMCEFDVTLKIDGKDVLMNEFVKKFISGTIIGMVSNLRGVESPHYVEIKLAAKEAKKVSVQARHSAR